MTDLLETLLGRLPIGWLQLAHNRARLAAALAGVAFANILILMQLGFMGALLGSIRLPYAAMDADILVSASDMNTLSDGGPVPRQRMFEALAADGVAARRPSTTERSTGSNPTHAADARRLRHRHVGPRLPQRRDQQPADGTRDRRFRPHGSADPECRSRAVRFDRRGEPFRFETKGRTLAVVGTFDIGGGSGGWIPDRVGSNVLAVVPAACARRAEPHPRPDGGRRRSEQGRSGVARASPRL